MTTTTKSTDRTAAAILARPQYAAGMLRDVQDALRNLRRNRARITFRSIAARAGVSRTFLYENPDARRQVDDTIATANQERRVAVIEPDNQAQASWREHALNAEDALTAANRKFSRSSSSCRRSWPNCATANCCTWTDTSTTCAPTASGSTSPTSGLATSPHFDLSAAEHDFAQRDATHTTGRLSSTCSHHVPRAAGQQHVLHDGSSELTIMQKCERDRAQCRRYLESLPS